MSDNRRTSAFEVVNQPVTSGQPDGWDSDPLTTTSDNRRTSALCPRCGRPLKYLALVDRLVCFKCPATRDNRRTSALVAKAERWIAYVRSLDSPTVAEKGGADIMAALIARGTPDER